MHGTMRLKFERGTSSIKFSSVYVSKTLFTFITRYLWRLSIYVFISYTLEKKVIFGVKIYIYSSLKIIWARKLRGIKWAGHVACMGKNRNACRVLLEKP